MLELIFLLPLIMVLLGISVNRYANHRRANSPFAWLVVTSLVCGAVALPLWMGVWIPDFLGIESTLAKSQSSSGHTFRVVQRWNYSDFYTTTLEVTNPSGTSKSVVLNGDDPKLWRIPLIVDETARTVSAAYCGRRVDVSFASEP